MISEREVFHVDGLTIDVNWESSVVPCKKIRFSFDGKEKIIDREDLYALMFLFGDEQQQTDLIPVKETQVRAITRLLKIKANKDVKAGGTITFPYTYYVPSAVYDKLITTPEYRSADKLSTPDLADHVNKTK